MEKAQKEKKPITKKWWFWVIIVVVILGIAGGIGGGAAGGNSNNSSENGGTVNNSSENGGTVNNQKVEYKLNDTVTVGDLQYTISSPYNTVKVGTLGTVTQNNYVVVTVTIKNNGSSEKYISDSNFKYCRENNKYNTHNDGIYLENGFWLNVTIGAGITKTIQVVYEIPSEYVSTDYIQVKDGFKTEKIYMK